MTIEKQKELVIEKACSVGIEPQLTEEIVSFMITTLFSETVKYTPAIWLEGLYKGKQIQVIYHKGDQDFTWWVNIRLETGQKDFCGPTFEDVWKKIIHLMEI